MKHDRLKGGSKPKSSHKPHDSEGRMSSPVAGNPAQRKHQVQGIANQVISEHEEPDIDDAEVEDQDDTSQGDPLFQGNHPSQASVSPVTHDHTVHDHRTNQSTTHKVPHGSDCPACGTEYMAHGR